MKEIIFSLLRQAFVALNFNYILDDLKLSIKVLNIKNQVYGDFYTNITLILCRQNAKAAYNLAKTIVAEIPFHPVVAKIAVADSGLINFFIHQQDKFDLIARILQQDFFRNNAENLNAKSIVLPALINLKSDKSLIYDVQIAYDRICIVSRQLEAHHLGIDYQHGLANLKLLIDVHEIELVTLLNQYFNLMSDEQNFTLDHLIYYLKTLALKVHSYYGVIVLSPADVALFNARLCLLKAIGQVLQNGIKLFGVFLSESM